MTATSVMALGRVVPGASSYTSQQGSVYAPGICAETVGAKAVFWGWSPSHRKAAPRRTCMSSTSPPSTC